MTQKVDHSEPTPISLDMSRQYLSNSCIINSRFFCFIFTFCNTTAKIETIFEIYKTFEAKKQLRVQSTWPYTRSVVEGIKSDVRYLAPLLMVFFQTFRMTLSHFVFSLLCVLNTSRKAYQLRLQLPLNQQLLMYSFLFPFLFFVLFTLMYPIKSKRQDYYREYDYQINDNRFIHFCKYGRQ